MQAPTRKRAPVRKVDTKASAHQSDTGHAPRTNSSSLGSMRTAKGDKRRIKHASLVSRIEKSNAKPRKRRRPSKKLVGNLESLVEALPEVSPEDQDTVMVGGVKLNYKSPRSKPGMMKRKQKIESMEREIFNRNAAQMTVLAKHDDIHNGATNRMDVVPDGKASSASVQRFAVLRTAIQASMGLTADKRAART